MGLWNLGSFATNLYAYVDEIPTAMSGTILLDLVDKRRLFMEAYLGQTVGSVDIAEKYQEPLLYLSIAATLNAINVQGTDANSISLGEFSINKGGGSSAGITSADRYTANAMEVMGDLKGRYNFKKANG